MAEYERIRRAYYVEEKSIRQIAKELGHCRKTVKKALATAGPRGYTLKQPRPAPVLGPYQGWVDKLLAEEKKLPRKQRYTSRKIYQLIQAQGYQGSQSGLRRYVGQQRREMKGITLYLPLAFDPGADAQVDWGQAWVEMASQRTPVQLFVMRLCYSRRTFAMAFPSQKQECFFAAHVAAFHYFQGIPYTLTYDNLKTAVKRVVTGRHREEQAMFVTFRSHYLFESRFCRVGKGNDKGGVEHGVGYVRRNFMVPLPIVAGYEQLNAHLHAQCQADDQRRVNRQTKTIGQAWQEEQGHLRPLPATDFACCRSREVVLNPYGQVVFETNRYSVPTNKARRHLTLKAYPFHIEILAGNEVIAQHQRCYGRQKDILEPLHYLPLLAQRPGAFEHAVPLRQWRAQWPPVYEQLLAALRQREEEAAAVREFVSILQLHQTHPAALVEQAIKQSLAEHLAHLEGVRFCLHRLTDPTPPLATLDLSDRPHLAALQTQAVSLPSYNQLLAEVRS